MSAPLPQTTGQRLFNQIEGLLDSDEMPSEFQLRRLEAQADELMSADAGEGLTVKAALAALRWDVSEVVKLAQRSTQVDPSHLTLLNAALTAKNVNLMEAACEFIERARAQVPYNPLVVEAAIVYLMNAGRITEAAQVMRQAIQDKVSLPEGELLDAVAFYDLLNELGIDPERVHYELQCGYQVLRRNRKRPRTIGYAQHDEPDGGRSVVISFEIQGDLDEEMRLESEMAVALAARDGWNPSLFGVEFAVVPEHAH